MKIFFILTGIVVILMGCGTWQSQKFQCIWADTNNDGTIETIEYYTFEDDNLVKTELNIISTFNASINKNTRENIEAIYKRAREKNTGINGISYTASVSDKKAESVYEIDYKVISEKELDIREDSDYNYSLESTAEEFINYVETSSGRTCSLLK